MVGAADAPMHFPIQMGERESPASNLAESLAIGCRDAADEQQLSEILCLADCHSLQTGHAVPQRPNAALLRADSSQLIHHLPCCAILPASQQVRYKDRETPAPTPAHRSLLPADAGFEDQLFLTAAL